MLDKQNVISRLQSTTVQNAIKLIVINVVVLLAAITGKAFNVEAIQTALDTWLPIALTLFNTFYGSKVVSSRVNAEATIEPLPWKEEIKSVIKKEK